MTYHATGYTNCSPAVPTADRLKAIRQSMDPGNRLTPDEKANETNWPDDSSLVLLCGLVLDQRIDRRGK